MHASDQGRLPVGDNFELSVIDLSQISEFYSDMFIQVLVRLYIDAVVYKGLVTPRMRDTSATHNAENKTADNVSSISHQLPLPPPASLSSGSYLVSPNTLGPGITFAVVGALFVVAACSL